jgi:hypothetical protein
VTEELQAAVLNVEGQFEVVVELKNALTDGECEGDACRNL